MSPNINSQGLLSPVLGTLSLTGTAVAPEPEPEDPEEPEEPDVLLVFFNVKSALTSPSV